VLGRDGCVWVGFQAASENWVAVLPECTRCRIPAG